MKNGFPRYSVTFQCACAVQEATKKISETVACQRNNLKMIGAYCTSVQKIVLRASTDGYVYYNSFMPIVNISMRELGDETLVSIVFEVKKSTKILMTLFSVFALLFEVALLVLWIMNQLTAIGLLFFPLGMLIFSHILSTVGLYFSSKGVLSVLFTAMTHEDAKLAPAIHRFKHIE